MNKHVLEDTAAIVRGVEPAPATTVLRHMVFGSGLTHALDYVVLLHMLFALEEDRPVTVRDLWLGLQAEGVRSAKNTKELVGRDAVYQSVNRLIKAGFVRRVEEGGKPGQFGSVRYEVYRQPAYNPDHMPAPEPWSPEDDPASPLVSPQVGPLPGTPEAEEAGKSQNDKTAGRTASRNAGYGNAGYGVPGSGKPRIPAGRTAYGVPGSGNPSPPTPPQVEVETSSTSSSSHTPAARTPQGPQGQRGLPVPDADRIAAAEEFLATLPGGWACGLKTAQNLAPKLAAHTLAQGWDLTPELAAHLTGNLPEKIHRRSSFLEGRIDDLERRDAVRPATTAGGSSGERCPYHPNREAASCVPCRSGGAPDPQEEPDMDPAAIAAAKEGLRLLDAPPPGTRGRARHPGRPRGQKAREAAQRREADAFEQRRAQALADLEQLLDDPITP
ncbi:hypothetical protein [Streptomyces aidingensis]|uniref:hypothetical protein n=1 Tax=Streptomyces aidingensis TaxID=910347 RepID=UPI001114A5A8|nr:hypothetical protein [Streptomyces aidingensis]